MGSILLPDFRLGMDRSRPRTAGAPRSLWTLKNAHITRGGDIERAKKFVPQYTLPVGTLGLASLRNQLWVFGSADLAASMPPGVLYQRLISPTGGVMVSVLSVRTFGGKFYVMAEFSSGNVHHFYDGTAVTDWNGLSDSNSNVTTLAEYLAEKINASNVVSASASGAAMLIQSRTPGTAFTIAVSTTNGGLTGDNTITSTTIQANVAAVAEVLASGTITINGGSFVAGVNQIKSVQINGVELLGVPVNWTSSNNSTASALAVAINNRTSPHGYTASAVGSTVTVFAAPGTGATPNAYPITVTATGNVQFSASSQLSGGVTAVAPVAQVNRVDIGGTYEALDQFVVTINGVQYIATGRASGAGTAAITHKQREWVAGGTLLTGSKLNTPSNFSDTSPASGFVNIDTSNHSDSGSERLTGLGQYSDFLAVFARNQIRLYSISADATLISFVQAVDNTGTGAGRSIVSYGNNDMFYLDLTGIRSLRTRQIINAPYVADVGTAIDGFIRDHVSALPVNTVSRAVSIIEPQDGRLWLALGERIYVLSFFPAKEISAWSYYEPGFSVSDFVRAGRQMYARAGDVIYLYGGADGSTYPGASEITTTVEFPFLSAESPALPKALRGYDIACSNEWHVELLVDPNDETETIDLGRPNRTSFHDMDIAVSGRSSLLAPKLTCDAAGAATVSSFSLHFDGKEPQK